jgi:hypothetical protein
LGEGFFYEGEPLLEIGGFGKDGLSCQLIPEKGLVYLIPLKGYIDFIPEKG